MLFAAALYHYGDRISDRGIYIQFEIKIHIVRVVEIVFSEHYANYRGNALKLCISPTGFKHAPKI